MTPTFTHDPVLVEEVVRLFAGCARILDGTVGGGGHARRFLESGSQVLGLDRDPAAVAAAGASLDGRGSVRLLDYGAAPADPDVRAFRPDGILLDLGVSSPQIDDPLRGFTFRPAAPLDMRMSGSGVTAADWLNEAEPDEMTATFAEWGDEPRARALAREVVHRRASRPFAVSDDLVGAIRAVLGPRSGPGDFARLFQAVRIAVNGELEQLAAALPALRDLLEPGGVLAVISYHSGEDRLVKHAFRDWARACVCPPHQPVCTCRGRPLGEVLTKHPLEALPAEVERNPRARSARLRAFRRAAS